MAYQTEQNKIVVDRDEEITTVIDHLRRMRGGSVMLVVPQRALILQSVVNLKLLIQEAQRLQKKISISTRDEHGLVLAQRAGIDVQPFVASDEEEIAQAFVPHIQKDHSVQVSVSDLQHEGTDETYARQRVDADIGSQSFYTQQRTTKVGREIDHETIQERQAYPSYTHGEESRAQNTHARLYVAEGQYAQKAPMQKKASVQRQYQREQKRFVSKDAQFPPKTYSFYDSGTVTMPDEDIPSVHVAAVSRNNPVTITLSPQEYAMQPYLGEEINRRIPSRTAAQRPVQQYVPRHVSAHAVRPQGSVVPRVHRDQQNYARKDDDLTQYEKSLSHARITSSSPTLQPAESHYATPQKNTPVRQSLDRHADPRTQQAHMRHAKNPSTRVRVTSQSPSSKLTKDHMAISSHARLWVRFLMFGALCTIMTTVGIIFAPQTTMVVTPKDIVINDTMEVTARTDQMTVDVERRLVPARVIERDITFVKNFSATGKGDVHAQKAQGTIVIYNTYNDKPQPLVASTRFLSENGTLFRLVKATTVPGMKNDEPGKVEALVIADKEGVDGNIGPGRFTVPGFDGSPKKEKFYAISEQSMIGGGAGGANVALVSDDDIMRAQKDMESEVQQYVQEQLSALTRPESEVLLPETIVTNTLRSESSMSTGTMSEQFMYEMVVHAYTMVFMQDDIKNILMANVTLPRSLEKDGVDMQFSFSNVQVKREDDEIHFNVQGNAHLVAPVALNEFKQDIIGKKHEDIRGIIGKKYKDSIEKVTVESVFPPVPQFISGKTSRFGFMTHVSVAGSDGKNL